MERMSQIESKVCSELGKINTNLLDTAREEFPDAAGQLGKECEALKKYEPSYIAFDDSAYDRLMSGYEKADREAERVRQALNRKIQSQSRRDPWYCDDEYNDARGVQNKYQSLAQDVNALQREYSGQCSAASVAEAKADKKLAQAKNLERAMEELEEKACRMRELRKKASEAKASVQEDFSGIDQKIAGKFLMEEYKGLESQVAQFAGISDQEAVEGCGGMLSAIEAFKGRLQMEYSRFLERQGMVRAQIDSLQNRVSHKAYSHPEDEFRSGGKKEMNSLLEFLQQYGKGSYVEEIGNACEKMEQLFAQEQFDKAEQTVKQATELVDKASEFAALTHENRMKTIFNMLSIQQAMIDLNYDVKVTKNKDGDDGYCVECSAGDECIKFGRVAVVEDGKAIIDIDHREATKGTCVASWHDIRKRLSEEGLFIEDIKKNGKSIHEPNSGQKRQAGEQGAGIALAGN